jgi:hypothetical protein
VHRFTKLIYILIVSLIVLLPNISNGLDEKVGLRCDETYRFDNSSLCYPADAVFKDGICECPAGGCQLCPTDSNGIQDYYCETPISTLANIKTKPPLIYFSRHYERFLYRNSCGLQNRRNFDWETCLAWFGYSGALGASIICSSIYSSNIDERGTEDIFAIKPNFNNIHYQSSTSLTSQYIISKLFRSKLEENSSYAVSPRIERLIIDNKQQDVLRLYFSQIHKIDSKQLLINLYSENSNDNYFTIDNLKNNDDDNNFWKSYKKWLPVEFCEKTYDSSQREEVVENGITYIRTDSQGNSGVNCYNGKYMAEQLIDRNNAALGIKIPAQPTEPFFPDNMSYYQGGFFKIPEPPSISWKISNNSTFMQPAIEVVFNENNGVNEDNKKIEINQLSEVFYYKVNNSFKYQLFMKIIDNKNFQNEKKLCLYTCQLHISDQYCIKKDILSHISGDFSLDEYLNLADKDNANLAQNIFITKPDRNESNICTTLQNITETNAVQITGLGIDSTYDKPKVKITINNQDPYIVALHNDDQVKKIIQLEDDQEFKFIKNTAKKEIFKPHIFNLYQDLNVKSYKQDENSVCSMEKESSCPADQFCLDKKCYNPQTKEIGGDCFTRSIGCNNGSSCFGNKCIIPKKTCDIYDKCSSLEKLSESKKSLICLRNLSKNIDNDNLSSHPYYINSNIVYNDSNGVKNFENNINNDRNNLCIPAPQKILNITHDENSNNYEELNSNISIQYLPAKLGEETPEAITKKIITGFKGVKIGQQESLIKRFDYHNNLKFIFTNENGLYCTYVQKYDYKNKQWSASGLDNLDNLTKLSNKYMIGQCKNLNYCLAGDAGILKAEFPKTKANTTKIIGKCSQQITDATEPQARCNEQGKWEKIQGKCVESCPAINTFKKYDVSSTRNETVYFNVSNTEISKTTTSTASCFEAYSGTVTITSQCGADAKWLKHEISHNCERTGCDAVPPYGKDKVTSTAGVKSADCSAFEYGQINTGNVQLKCDPATNKYDIISETCAHSCLMYPSKPFLNGALGYSNCHQRSGELGGDDACGWWPINTSYLISDGVFDRCQAEGIWSLGN